MNFIEALFVAFLWSATVAIIAGTVITVITMKAHIKELKRRYKWLT